MVTVPTTEVSDPAAWTAEELLDDQGWRYVFSKDDLGEFDAALRVSRQKPILDTTEDDFPVTGFRKVLDEMAWQLESGRGIYFLSGLPVYDRFSEDDAARIFWAIGSYLGDLVPQNDRGHRLGTVAFDPTQRGSRGYYSNRPLNFHSDPSDIVALMALRPGVFGGRSLVASSLQMHNVMLQEAPDLLALLYESFAMDWQNEEPPGSPRYYESPIFRYADGLVSSRMGMGTARAAQRLEEVPRLTAKQVQALNFIEKLGEREELHITQELQPGDMQFLNNYVCTHGRTPFEDDPEDEKRQRRLLRLWVMCQHWKRSSYIGEVGIPTWANQEEKHPR